LRSLNLQNALREAALVGYRWPRPGYPPPNQTAAPVPKPSPILSASKTSNSAVTLASYELA